MWSCVFLRSRGDWEELKELRDKWHLINQSTPLSLLWETKGQHFRTVCYDQCRNHSPLSESAPKVLPPEQHNSHSSSQQFTVSVPQSTREGLQGNCSAWEVLWVGSLGCHCRRLFSRDSQNRYKTIQADVISSTERAQLWKSFPSALDQAPQGQHSFSANWSTNWCCLTQRAFCDN